MLTSNGISDMYISGGKANGKCLKRRGPLKQTEGEWTNVLSVIFKIRFLHRHLSQLATVQRLTILPKRQHLPWVTAMFLRCCNAQTINNEDVFVL